MRKVLALLCASIALSLGAPAFAAEPLEEPVRPRAAVREARHDEVRQARASHGRRSDAPPGVTAVPATSTVVRLDDTMGEVDVTDEAGDVTAAEVDLRNGHVVRLGFTTARFEPLTGVTWDDQASFAIWFLETTGDDVDDYEVFATTVDGRPVAGVFGFTDDRVRCTAAFQGSSASGYRVDLPASCLGDPAEVRSFLILDYDPDPVEMALPLSLDLVPDEDHWSPAATRGPRPRPHAKPAARRGARFYLRDDLGNGFTDVRLDYGVASDVGLLCDWDGDGSRTLSVFRSGRWYFRNHNAVTASRSFVYGTAGDVPVCGDWDGDGRDTPGVYRGGRWYLRHGLAAGFSSSAVYGLATDRPVVGDWDGDGTDTVGVVRGATWYLRAYGGGTAHRFAYGYASDVPVVGDWDGDGRDTPGGYRDGEWHVRNTLASGRTSWIWQYGIAGDTPLVWR